MSDYPSDAMPKNVFEGLAMSLAEALMEQPGPYERACEDARNYIQKAAEAGIRWDRANPAPQEPPTPLLTEDEAEQVCDALWQHDHHRIADRDFMIGPGSYVLSTAIVKLMRAWIGAAPAEPTEAPKPTSGDPEEHPALDVPRALAQPVLGVEARRAGDRERCHEER